MERMLPLSVESESCIQDVRHLPDTCSSEERLTKAAQELSAAAGSTCIAVKADVRDPKQIQTAVQRTIERYGRIDFVINGHLSLLT
jgi:NAD(P)-dependent dehydrogenase (short-subunit alcohol dehydrogenase family)